MEDDRRTQSDRRKIDENTEDFRSSVIEQLAHGDGRMASMEAAIQLNTGAVASLQEEVKKLRENQGSTAELLEFFESVKGAFRVFDAVGKLAKPLGAIIALGVSCMAAWKAWISR